MPSYDNIGRIPQRTASNTLLALSIIALLSAVSRFTVRLYYQRKLFWDDALLATAILMLCTDLGLWFSFVDDMYFAQSILLGNLTPDMDLTILIPKAIRLHKLSDVALVLSWTSFCTVKLSCLVFFRTLTVRTSGLRQYWWCVIAFTALTWAGGAPMEIIACPYFDERALACAQGPKLKKTITIAAILQALNITSDLLIISIPVLILHRIKVPLRTKIILGVSLCLSAVTVAITLIRIIGMKIPGKQAVDVVWQVYWQYIESCIGIIVVSVTAFRIFYVQRAARISAKRSTPRSYFAHRFRSKLRRHGHSEIDPEYELQGYIPGGTMTGMITFIGESDKIVDLDTEMNNGFREGGDRKPLRGS